MTHLVIIGFDEIVSNKYIDIIEKAILENRISSYSIIDLKSEEKHIKHRINKLKIKPKKEYYLNDKNNREFNINEIDNIFKDILDNNYKVKVYIATELKSHLFYLNYCISKCYDCLVEKPIFAPRINNMFAPHLIESTMNNLVSESAKNKVDVSVMTLGRYHPIYNKIILKELKDNIIKYESPITSIHLRAAGGVWNLHDEYLDREDHPYKYGYGMLMHGGYHYIDVFTQIIELNKLLFPNDKLVMNVKTYGAFPFDQNERISKKYSNIFDDNKENWKHNNKDIKFGETDIVSVLELRNETKNNVLTIGTISLEQTTPSIRFWKEFPPHIYNKNGRISSVDLEVRLSTLYSIHVNCYDVPEEINNNIEKIGARSTVVTRSNFNLLKTEKPITVRNFEGLFHNLSNKEVMENWINGEEKRSNLKQHINVMNILGGLAISLNENGREVTIALE